MLLPTAGLSLESVASVLSGMATPMMVLPTSLSLTLLMTALDLRHCALPRRFLHYSTTNTTGFAPHF